MAIKVDGRQQRREDGGDKGYNHGGGHSGGVLGTSCNIINGVWVKEEGQVDILEEMDKLEEMLAGI